MLMLFADTELARRIEQADCEMLEQVAAALRQDEAENDVFLHQMQGGVASYIRPGSPLNKLAGLGFAGPIQEADLTLVERAHEQRGMPLQAEVSTLADPQISALLTSRGYVMQNCENILACRLPLADLPPAAPDIAITSDDGGPSSEWLDVMTTGFASPDTQGVASHEEFPRDVIEQTIRDFTQTNGFHCYEARREGVLAGGASLRLANGLAQLAGAATLPAHRRRGVQSALLYRRLADAAEQGCDLAVVTTQPGSKSQQNVQRLGFQLLYTRVVLVREAR